MEMDKETGDSGRAGAQVIAMDMIAPDMRTISSVFADG